MQFQGRKRPCVIAVFAFSGIFASSLAPAIADDRFEVPTPSNYGGVGLLDTRTARFFPDGYLALTASLTSPDDRYAITAQALPWIEFTFRYSINQAIAFNPVLHDRSFDAKFRLSHESEYVPEIALGFQDFIGTGVYSGEYLVGSKRFGPLDFTVGFGWGRLGARGTFKNPFCAISSGFCTRNGESSSSGGSFAINSYFHGPDVGVFGGIEYDTPIENLKLKIEYSADAYTEEKLEHGKDYSFPVNAGVSYRPFSWLDIGVSIMHGHYAGVRLSALTDVTAENWLARIDPAPRFRARPAEAAQTILQPDTPAASANQDSADRSFVDLTRTRPEPAANPQDLGFPTMPPLPPVMVPGALNPSKDETAPPGFTDEVQQRIKAGMDAQKLTLRGLAKEGNRLVIIIENPRYRRDPEAVARTARVLSATAPADIEMFEITLIVAGQPETTVKLQRREIDHLARRDGSPAELFQSAEVLPGQSAPLDHLQPGLFPAFDWAVYPVFQQSFFDPLQPFYFRVAAGALADLQVMRGWTIDGSVTATIYDNFNQIQRVSNSVLPHVRSDIAKYLKQGRYGVDNLSTSYFFKVTPEIYGRLSGGLLESMFAGVGGELLYRPYTSRWAIGVDLWAVRQRGYNELFDLLRYQTLTGHITAYYELPWHNVGVAISAGQYLAGDKGVTFQFWRSFSTGVQIGAWFTLTNVSAQQFGEGSFDKGIQIIIPLEWVAPFATRGSYNLALRPIQRDGGQRLGGDTVLFGMTDGSSYGAFTQEWNSVFH